MQFRIILIRLILALRIGNRIRGTESGHDIHVTVSVIARDTAMFQPYHPLKTECMLQFAFDLLLLKILVPVERAQALLRGKKSSLPVRVNASPFQYERSHIHAGHILSENILEEYRLGYLIVLV